MPCFEVFMLNAVFEQGANSQDPSYIVALGNADQVMIRVRRVLGSGLGFMSAL